MRYAAVAAVLAVAVMSSSTDAGWFDQFVDHCQTGCQQNQRWPSPYVCPDRVYAHAPFDAMVRNGWRRQNLLGSHHFNAESNQLTKAGELKVHWIMTQTPLQYRRIFIERSIEEGTTDNRIAAINDYASRLAGGQDMPQVTPTHIVSEGRPASTVDFVNSQYRENMRVPVLPVSTVGSGE